MASRVDYVGQRFNFLVAVREVASRKIGGRRYEFACDCGGRLEVSIAAVKKGNTKSCGCYGKKLRDQLGSRYKTHGQSCENSRTYRTWNHVIQRTTNPRCKQYCFYGGRGITVCERWKSFDSFLADMGERPVGTSIDRIDPDGHYEPGNCRWADKFVQARNKRCMRLNADLVNEIHGRSEHGESRKSIAAHMGIKHDHVRIVLTGRSWKEFMPGVYYGVQK